jgi:AcrR family transcriptional regulator
MSPSPIADSRIRGAALLRDDVSTAIEAAVFAELAQAGYARMSMDAVAKRAGVGKAAIYRRWASKEQMVIALVRAYATRAAVVVSTGSLHDDVLAFLSATKLGLEHPLVAPMILDLASEAGRNPQLAEALRTTISEPRRATVAELLRLAIDRGELEASVDVDLALDFLAGPLAVRMLITRMPIGGDSLEQLTNWTIAALRG